MDDLSWDLFSFLQEVDEQGHTLSFALSPPPPPPPPLSQLRCAFSNYKRFESRDGGLVAWRQVGSAVNVHRRLFGFLRRIGDRRAAAAVVRAPAEADDGAAGAGWSLGFRHMMRERQRRERISQGYADLHAMLHSSLKGDKISVVKAAAAHVRELKHQKKQLQRRNAELEIVAAGPRPTAEAAAAAIKLTITNCSMLNAMDALIVVLRCLKLMELKITAVRSSFFGENLLVVAVGLEMKVDAVQVENTMTSALMDAEKKFCAQKSTQQSKWSLTCHVENVT